MLGVMLYTIGLGKEKAVDLAKAGTVSAYTMVLRICIWGFVKMVHCFYVPLDLLRIFQRARKCSRIDDPILLLTASELAERIRHQEIKSEDVVGSYIQRILEVNPIINAMIEDRFEEALTEARSIDEQIAKNVFTVDYMRSQLPLLGVPLTVKGSIAVAGMHLHAGVEERRHHLATEDAVPVKLARQAGAIPLLLSNVPELCLNWETTNKIVGTTKNPFDTTRTPGGSSGGEASLIASGASLIGIGSDIAGSLRLPAHFCGIWGHKPSPGAVSFEGHYPSCNNKIDWEAVFTLGPLARYAEDLKLLFQCILQPHVTASLKLNDPIQWNKLKCYYIEELNSPVMMPVNLNVKQAIRRVTEHLDTLCTTKSKLANLALMKRCSELSYLRLLMLDDIDNLFDNDGNGAYSELIRSLLGVSQSQFTSVMYGVLRRNKKLLPEAMIRNARKSLEVLRAEFLRLLDTDGVFICPTFPSEAPYHGDVYRRLFSFGYLAIFNALGFPVTNCPVMVTDDGLPVGIQIVAAPNCDRLTLGVAEELERKFKGWTSHASNTGLL